jgi:hypothetical protein
MAQFVTVVNRTKGARKRTLYVTFDGVRQPIPPGESQLEERIVPYACRQNPVMGSMNPYDPVKSTKFLIGVKGRETKFPTFLVDEDPGAIELVNRSMLPGKAHLVQGRAATAWELRDENPTVDGAVAAGGD